MTKYLSAAETAKVVRKLLKTAFPGIKYGYHFQDYRQENLYWRELTHSVLDSSGQILNTAEVA